MVERLSPRKQFVVALLLSTLVSAGLLVYGAWRSHSLDYGYLLWNLALAWLPFGLSLWLIRILKRELWSSWSGLIVSLLWLSFLPNSFYMVSDFIHIQNVQTSDVLYDVVMFTSFIFTGVVLGFSSLYLVHKEFLKRFSARASGSLIAAILMLCSFAIYIGRDLRWNSWDILANPTGLIFDLSDRFLHPRNYGQMSLTVIIFFVLLASMYVVVWRTTQLFKETTES